MIKQINRIKYKDSPLFFLIAGPCVVEDEEIIFEVGNKIKAICADMEIPFIFKASYKKANRSRLDSFSGIGDIKALEILKETGESLDIPILTDVHGVEEVKMAAQYVDVLQIPAFLCRQTELLIAAGESGKPVNIKKGQFLSPASMRFAIEKVRSTGNNRVMVTDRGTFFGYNDLVVDMRGIPEMPSFDVPVVLDITHSLQRPNTTDGITGGNPKLIGTIGKAGIAAGADGIFLETHPRPADAKSDGANMLPLEQLQALLSSLVKIRTCLE